MVYRLLLIVFMVLDQLSGWAQNDSIAYNPATPLTEGIYLNYNDFRKNDAIKKEQVETNINKEQLDFFGKVIDQEKLTYIKSSSTNTILTKDVWGYVQNGTLFINYKNNFYRVPVFGSICHFVALVEVSNYYPGYYPVNYGGTVGTSVKTKEVREFIMNFYDGITEEQSMEKIEKLLSRDETIYKEYMSLKKKKRREQVSRYIRKYNELHPIYFLK